MNHRTFVAGLDAGSQTKANPQPTICWFRNDLRLTDHAALAAAAANGPVLAVFILDDDAAGPWKMGGASRWWLHHSLASLTLNLAQKGGRLVLRRGDTVECLETLIKQENAKALYFSRAYEPWAAEQQRCLKERFDHTFGESVEVKRFAGRLLLEPEQVSTQEGRPYKVFTPFWRASMMQLSARDAEKTKRARAVPATIQWHDAKNATSDELDAWQLLPDKPDWAAGLREFWQPGEKGAFDRLKAFLDLAIDDYPTGRDQPDEDFTSRLSPYLHFGEISPEQIWRAVKAAAAGNQINETAGNAFLRQLGWRDFSYHLLSFFPALPESNFRPQFDQFPWQENQDQLEAWRRGQTGYPLVDAGMRQLWHTGWMHNRVRMVVGSFLVKHLRMHWRHGENWFWDTLVDADLANNAASWQWVAGSGADAAPYFRIFNPITQGEKFDQHGAYIRHWVPELRELPKKFLNKPWTAPKQVLSDAGVVLGENYPKPIVDHRAAREAALSALQQSKG